MSARVPFGLDQIDGIVRHLGDAHFVQDPLNGADFMFASPDMMETAKQIVADYARTAWAFKTILIYEKNVLPEGHIVGFRGPTGSDGPYADAVWSLTPAGAFPCQRAIEAEDLDELIPEIIPE